MEENIIKQAAINSPYDARDYPLDMLVSASETVLPETYITKTTVPVFAQGSTGCCVACALASSRYIQEELQEGSASKFSVNYIYGNRLPTDTQNEGMIARQALKTLLDYGVCHWTDFAGYNSYPTAKENYEKNKEKYDDLAYPYKINSYYRLYNTEEIKTAVYELGCAVASYDMTDPFLCPGADGYVKYDSSEKVLGQHMVTITGWTKDKYWIVLNSWGTDYGANGYCYMPFGYPIIEAWAMIDNRRYQDLIFERQLIKTSGTLLGLKGKHYVT